MTWFVVIFVLLQCWHQTLSPVYACSVIAALNDLSAKYKISGQLTVSCLIFFSYICVTLPFWLSQKLEVGWALQSWVVLRSVGGGVSWVWEVAQWWHAKWSSQTPVLKPLFPLLGRSVRYQQVADRKLNVDISSPNYWKRSSPETLEWEHWLHDPRLPEN